MKHLDIENKT